MGRVGKPNRAGDLAAAKRGQVIRDKETHKKTVAETDEEFLGKVTHAKIIEDLTDEGVRRMFRAAGVASFTAEARKLGRLILAENLAGGVATSMITAVKTNHGRVTPDMVNASRHFYPGLPPITSNGGRRVKKISPNAQLFGRPARVPTATADNE